MLPFTKQKWSMNDLQSPTGLIVDLAFKFHRPLSNLSNCAMCLNGLGLSWQKNGTQLTAMWLIIILYYLFVPTISSHFIICLVGFYRGKAYH